MSTFRRWSDADDTAILATIRQPATEIAATLGRTFYAVEQRHSRLFKRGVLTERGQHPGDLNRTWTPEEDALVIATVARPIAEVALLIPSHTPVTISCRRRTIKVRGELARETLSRLGAINDGDTPMSRIPWDDPYVERHAAGRIEPEPNPCCPSAPPGWRSSGSNQTRRPRSAAVRLTRDSANARTPYAPPSQTDASRSVQ